MVRLIIKIYQSLLMVEYFMNKSQIMLKIAEIQVLVENHVTDESGRKTKSENLLLKVYQELGALPVSDFSGGKK